MRKVARELAVSSSGSLTHFLCRRGLHSLRNASGRSRLRLSHERTSQDLQMQQGGIRLSRLRGSGCRTRQRCWPGARRSCALVSLLQLGAKVFNPIPELNVSLSPGKARMIEARGCASTIATESWEPWSKLLEHGSVCSTVFLGML